MPDSINGVSAATRKRQKANGVVRLNEAEFAGFFDLRARNGVKMSGVKALKRIRSGRAGSNLAWTELVLLSGLLADK